MLHRSLRPRLRTVLAGTALGLLCALPPAVAHPAPPPDAAQVSRAIAERRSRVPEFELVKQAAEELGIRVWLFGGTAAGFAHYVRWDLAREGGDERYRPTFFDYDFTNIYRSTQDADLVVDATPEQAAALEKRIREKMSFLQGSKEHWEVRLLRQSRTTPAGQVKQALLANPDFLGQHTDSNSTGMIELTDPPPGEGVVRDLRDWTSGEPFFLQDVTEGRLHYYRSPTHETTTRFREGHNPPLFSVIRYLVKAFQYGLRVDGQDLEQVKAIIDAFDPKRDYPGMSQWAKGWLERYGPNLIRHAVDVEYAWNTLQELGLRTKLVALSDRSKEGSLGWWLSKEPLRTGPLGEGQGATAAELGIEVVAHETRDFLAYESITRDMTGRPNVLISREGYPGETALKGPGFYARVGRTGARGTGLTIRFRIAPEAREGSDFTRAGDYLVITNRAALRVIPESLDGSLADYFEMLRDGLLDPNERGAWMKLKRRLTHRPVSGEEERRILAIVSEEVRRVAEHGAPSRILAEWRALPLSTKHPEVLERLTPDARLALEVSELIEREEVDFPALNRWFALPASRRHPGLVMNLIERHASFRYKQVGNRSEPHDKPIEQVLRLPGWAEPPELIRALLGKKMFSPALTALQEQGWSDHPELALEAIDGMALNDWWTCYPLFERGSTFIDHPAFLTRMMSRGGLCHAPVYFLFTERPPTDRPELILALVEGIAAIPPGVDWAGKGSGEDFGNRILQVSAWKRHPRLRDLCGGRDPTVGCLADALRGDLRRVAGGVADTVGLLSERQDPADCGPEGR